MIKMFINDEEVVSNKELVIKEEMLATSSAILNNCYPKTWEDIKDYTSNFYYPKDYSRCIIGQGSFKYGTNRYAKLNISGIFPTFETNIEKPFDKIQIDGKSTQATSTQSANLCPPFTDSRWTFINGASVTNEGYLSIPANSGARAVINIPWNKSRTCYFKDIIVSGGNAHYSGAYFDATGTQLSGNGKATADKDANYQDGTMWGGNNQYGDALTQATNIKFTIQFSNYTSNPYVIKDLIISENDINYIPFTPDMPSPEYPSEIESVKGKNLFDKNSVETQIGYFTSDGTLKSGGNSTVTTTYTKILPNTDMTISGFALEWICFYDKNKNFIERVAGTLKTFNKNAYYIRIQASTNVFDLSKIQLEKGTIATNYLPYNTIQIKDVGKNLYGNITWQVQTYAYTQLPTLNEDYTLSLKLKDEKQVPAGLYVMFTEKGIYETTQKRIDIVQNGTLRFPHMINTIGNVKLNYISIYPSSYKDTLQDYFDIQLEKGTQATTYEPYQENIINIDLQGNELCSLPNNVKDELVIENGRAKIIKNVGKYNITGNEAWALSGTESQPYINFGNYVDNCKYPATSTELPNLLSNYYLQITRNNLYDGRITLSPSKALIIYDTVHNTSLANFKEWLKSAGVVVYYQLATPIEIDLGEVETLSTFKGINNVSLDTNMQTNMSLTYLWENYGLLFCGIVKNSGNISLNPRYPHFGSFQILDFKAFLSESDTLDFVISNKTITEAIEMVIGAISTYGFILGNIKIFGADDVIGAYSTQNKTAYDVFQYIAEITGSRWFTRLIDEKTIAIDFYDPTLMERGNNLEYNEKYFEDNYVVDLSFSYGSRDYRNKQVILSDEIYASIDYTEVILSNGYQTTFNTENNIGIIKSIYIDNTEKTFATNNEKETGIDAEFYYTLGKSSFESDGSTYPAGTQITITYTPLVRGRQVVYNNDEVARIYAQTGRKGVIARYESRNDILSSKELDKVGQSYIKYKGSPEVILTLTIEEKDLYNIGQIVYFDSPIPELAQDYMIKSKQIKIIMIDEISQKVFFIYELTSSFNAEKEINYFDNQRNKNKGNISVGETITRNIDIENTANIIFKDMTINEASATGNNLLNSVLNSPFVE